MQSLNPQPYTVRAGDTLQSVARQFGFSDWRDIYRSPANSAFRELRSNPDQVRPGDRLFIPPTPDAVRAVMQERLSALLKMKHDTEALYQQIEQDMDANIKRYESVSEGVDAAATVATIFVGLGKIVVKGMAAMKLSGAALAHANKELGKESVKFAFDPLREPALKFAADHIGANDGIVWLFGKATIEAFLNIQSPSWWAGVIGNLQDGKSWSDAVTSDPKDALKAARDRVDAQRRTTILRIDQTIRATQQYLNGLSQGTLLSLYDGNTTAYA